jgi:formyl-CoA transferase
LGPGGQAERWRVIARNKYSVGVDLRSAEGQDLARDLIARADILIENFRPGTLENGTSPLRICARRIRA